MVRFQYHHYRRRQPVLLVVSFWKNIVVRVDPAFLFAMDIVRNSYESIVENSLPILYQMPHDLWSP